MRSETGESCSLKRGLESFKDYVGLKLHFNEEFIFTRAMADRLKQTTETLMRRKDAFLFVRLGEKETRDKAFERLISLFKQNQSAWIGEVFEEEAIAFHKQRLAVVSSLSHSLKTDVGKIRNWMDETGNDLKKSFTVRGSPPIIVKSRIPGGVKDETLSVLNRAFGFCNHETDDPLWERRRRILSKYSHWLPLENQFLREQCDRLT